MSILDPKFVYRDRFHTDLRKTFARVRRRMREQAAREASAQVDAQRIVRPLKKGGAS